MGILVPTPPSPLVARNTSSFGSSRSPEFICGVFSLFRSVLALSDFESNKVFTLPKSPSLLIYYSSYCHVFSSPPCTGSSHILLCTHL